MLLARKQFVQGRISYLFWDKFKFQLQKKSEPTFTFDSKKAFPKAYFLKVPSPILHSEQNSISMPRTTMKQITSQKNSTQHQLSEQGLQLHRGILPMLLWKFMEADHLHGIRQYTDA